MAIPSAAKHKSLARVDPSTPLVDRGGFPNLEGLRKQEEIRSYIVGAGRIIPCSCSTTNNVLTLTPNGHGSEDGESPILEGYRFGDMYLFVADASTTNSVTATVVPKKGTLATLKVYITNGAAQAGNGDITAGLVYIGVYAYNLDANAGGIVIRHP